MSEPLSEAELTDLGRGFPADHDVNRLVDEVRRLRPKFTATLPTTGGYYWWRGPGEGDFEIKEVFYSDGGLRTDHEVRHDGHRECGLFKVAEVGGEWAGPLAPPE